MTAACASAGDSAPVLLDSLGAKMLAGVAENLGPALDEAFPPGMDYKTARSRRADIVAEAIDYGHCH